MGTTEYRGSKPLRSRVEYSVFSSGSLMSCVKMRPTTDSVREEPVTNRLATAGVLRLTVQACCSAQGRATM